jgi:hypothetical protein
MRADATGWAAFAHGRVMYAAREGFRGKIQGGWPRMRTPSTREIASNVPRLRADGSEVRRLLAQPSQSAQPTFIGNSTICLPC